MLVSLYQPSVSCRVTGSRSADNGKSKNSHVTIQVGLKTERDIVLYFAAVLFSYAYFIASGKFCVLRVY